MCQALYWYLLDSGMLIDEDYVDDETFRVMSMDFEIESH